MGFLWVSYGGGGGGNLDYGFPMDIVKGSSMGKDGFWIERKR